MGKDGICPNYIHNVGTPTWRNRVACLGLKSTNPPVHSIQFYHLYSNNPRVPWGNSRGCMFFPPLMIITSSGDCFFSSWVHWNSYLIATGITWGGRNTFFRVTHYTHIRHSGQRVVLLACFLAAYSFSEFSYSLSWSYQEKEEPSSASWRKIKKCHFWVAFCCWVKGWGMLGLSPFCCKMDDWEIWLLQSKENSKQYRNEYKE